MRSRVPWITTTGTGATAPIQRSGLYRSPTVQLAGHASGSVTIPAMSRSRTILRYPEKALSTISPRTLVFRGARATACTATAPPRDCPNTTTRSGSTPGTRYTRSSAATPSRFTPGMSGAPPDLPNPR